MSSSVREQTFEGYVSEYCEAHHVSPLAASQTAMCKLFVSDVINEREKEKGDKNK